MAFADDVNRFKLHVATKSRDVFVGVAVAVRDSIVEGSPITGAPGQPVDTGALKASWILAFDGPTTATISTNIVYAPFIEHGIITARTGQVTGNTQQRLTLRSPVGGFHSVKLTVAGYARLVEHVVAEHSDA